MSEIIFKKKNSRHEILNYLYFGPNFVFGGTALRSFSYFFFPFFVVGQSHFSSAPPPTHTHTHTHTQREKHTHTHTHTHTHNKKASYGPGYMEVYPHLRLTHENVRKYVGIPICLTITSTYWFP